MSHVQCVWGAGCVICHPERDRAKRLQMAWAHLIEEEAARQRKRNERLQRENIYPLPQTNHFGWNGGSSMNTSEES